MIKVIYEDNHILVVFKPRNVLSQKDKTDDDSMVEYLKKYLKEKYHKPGNVYLGLVHRLDRPVAGLMVFAKTSKAAQRLSEAFKKREVEKVYFGVIHNNLVNDKGIVKDIYEGKEEILSYEVVLKKDDLALVKINLITGKKHQIRRTFKNLNSPLYGDKLYGLGENGGIALFAYSLKFFHPVKKEQCFFKYLPLKKEKNEIFDLFFMNSSVNF